MGEAKRRRQRVEALHASVSAQFPTLRAFARDGRIVIAGMFPIQHEGRELDRFAIDIDLGNAGAGKLPSVRETGGRIPKTMARHINADGTACVCMPEHYFSRNPGPFDVLAFLDGPVRDFFLGQIMVDAGEPWPFGEWAHGEAGRDAWLQEFAASLTSSQREAFKSAIEASQLDTRASCPCGRDRSLEKCHIDLLTNLRTMPHRRVAGLFSAGTGDGLDPGANAGAPPQSHT